MNEVAVQERNNYIVDLAFKGLDQVKIAEEVGLSQSQVSKILRLDEGLKATIKKATEYNIERLPATVVEHDRILRESEDEKIRMDAIKLRYSITGISPSHTQNIYIQNLHQDNRSVQVGEHTELNSLLTLKRKIDLDKDVIDVKPLELDKPKPGKDEGDK